MSRTVNDAAVAEVDLRLRNEQMESHVAVLREEIHRLRERVAIARSGLWQAWIETGSIAAKECFDRTAP